MRGPMSTWNCRSINAEAEQHMHKSKLAGFIIDCRTKDLEGVATFWAAALGMEKRALPDEEGKTYIALDDPEKRMVIEVQTVDHESRVHLDIAADDIEAEVRRLEALGAKRIDNVKHWVVMEAPTGQRFCVVPGRSENFKKTARTWK
jgi:predicted enzyme related to lactoylglutathione lyase